MPHINELLERLRQDFSAYRFEPQAQFKWMPISGTVGYCIADDKANPNDCFDLLHELGHAELAHTSYRFDIELLRQENAAWQLAEQQLAPHYGLAVPTDYIEDCLETYRDWLFARSRCPNCQQTGLQTQTSAYSCINCGRSWDVNDARQCALRRYLQP